MFIYRAENKSGLQIKIQFYPVQSSFRPRFKKKGDDNLFSLFHPKKSNFKNDL